MSEQISEFDYARLKSDEKLLGENLKDRLNRFSLIVENLFNNWDLSDRDMNALRTANAFLKTCVCAKELNK